MFVPVQAPQVSPRARELGHELAEVIRRYRGENPATRPVEVRQAFHVAAQEMRGEMGGMAQQGRAILIASLGLGVSMFLGCLLYMKRVAGSGGADTGAPWILIAVVGVGILGALLAVLIAKTRR